MQQCGGTLLNTQVIVHSMQLMFLQPVFYMQDKVWVCNPSCVSSCALLRS